MDFLLAEFLKEEDEESRISGVAAISSSGVFISVITFASSSLILLSEVLMGSSIFKIHIIHQNTHSDKTCIKKKKIINYHLENHLKLHEYYW